LAKAPESSQVIFDECVACFIFYLIDLAKVAN
jgi:hypothetical protein